jgi:peptidoglycan/LPS O-acetylase OafA/YrhL
MANMAVVCACIVALSHVGYNTAAGSAAWWFVRLTRYGLCCLAVPFFFAVSGYFLSRHFDERGWWLRETGKRVTSLLLPYLLWCIAFFAFWRIGAAAVKAGSAGEFLQALRLPASKLANAFGLRMDVTPCLVPVWYIRALIVIVLVSPFLALMSSFRYGAALSAAVFFCAYVAFSPHRNGLASTRLEHFLYYGVSLMGMAYFQLGILLRRTGFLERTLRVPAWFGAGLFALGVAALVLRTRIIAATGSEPFPVLCLAIPLLVSGLWLLLPAAEWPRKLTSMSFPIYVMHYFVVFALDGFHKPSADKSICLMLVQAALAVAIPCAIAFVARRMLPRAASTLFGGR